MPIQEDHNLYPAEFEADEAFALRLDATDPLRGYRDRFHLPKRADGKPLIYFCSHSLGLEPKSVGPLLAEELDNWARLGVKGHFHGKTPWYIYQDLLRPSLARLVGAKPSEVIAMNGLTINLHLMMVSFYRPEGKRRKIVIDQPTFPSDLYAVGSQLRLHRLDAATLLCLQPHSGQHLISTQDIEAVLHEQGKEIALVLLSGVNFFTGQLFDLRRLTAAAKRHGCVVGLDLAHAVGNVELDLHAWEVDFAVWCHYKYVNAGPGAVAGCFVHETHGRNLDLPRLAGWWGNDPATRFRMHPEFVPHAGADGWQVSNPPILALAPLRAALAIFDEVGMPRLRAKSRCLTAYLQYLLDRLPPGRFEVITPRDAEQRGCQLSLLVHERPQDFLRALESEGIIVDFREPNVVRIAPVPLYNGFHEIWQFARILDSHLR